MLYKLNGDINMKIVIKIQSISDIITNSSSEVFCTITGPDIDIIKELIFPLFPNKDSEMGPTVSFDDETNCIEINMPYGIEGFEEFLRLGLEAYLDKYLGGHYNVTCKW